MCVKSRLPRVKYAIMVVSLLLIGVSELSSQNMKTFHFGHSLVQHDNEYSNLFHWMYEMSSEAGYTYQLEGQFGFLSNQYTPIQNLNMGSTIYNTAVWDTDFATTGFDNITITAAYYCHYEHEAWEDSYGVVRLDELQRIADYSRGELPNVKVYLYAPWTEPGEPTTMTAGDFEYFKNDSRALHDWWVRTQDTLNGTRPNLDAKIIPVGQVLADALDNVPGLDVLTPTDIFVDDAGHGTPTFYFMAAMVHYMARWGEQCPSTYTVPNNIHETVRTNYTNLITYIWNELQTYNHPDGSSRVFFSNDETAPTVPDGLISTAITATTVNLAWNPSTDENGVSSYRVYTNGANVVAVTDTNATITGLSPNTSYNFTVSAGDRAGNWSAQSSALQVSTLDLQIFTLTVVNGSGGGDYSAGTEITVTADAPANGLEFDTWTGDIQYLASASASSTTLTMPASAVSISATYTAIQTGDTITVEAEDYTNMLGIQVEVTTDVEGGQQVGYINNNDWIEYNIDFPSSGTYNIGYRISSEGSVGDMSVTIDGLNPTYVDVPTTGAFETYTTVWGEINIPTTGVQTLRITSIGEGWNINWIKLVPIISAQTYTLTVNYGSGSGEYQAGTVVPIEADAADPGLQFDSWIGDNAGVADVNLANTSITMPASNVTISALYSLITNISNFESEITVYPNPVSQGEPIQFKSVELSHITITDIMGKVVLEQNIEHQQNTINTSSFNKGVYFINLRTTDNKQIIKRIIVE